MTQHHDFENYPVGTLLVRRKLPYATVNPNEYYVIVEVVDGGPDGYYPGTPKTRYSYKLLRSDGQMMRGIMYLPDLKFNYTKVKAEELEE